jgi:hypothetical protein
MLFQRRYDLGETPTEDTSFLELGRVTEQLFTASSQTGGSVDQGSRKGASETIYLSE